MKNNEKEVDENCVGFNLPKENLHCMIRLDDDIAALMSKRAGTAFFVAFIVEDRATGEVWCKFRYRYKDGDAWYHQHLGADMQQKTVAERVKYIADGFERMLRLALSVMGDTTVAIAKDSVARFYPPHPEDPEGTLRWLLEQDLVEITEAGAIGGGDEKRAL